jgi:hypothetical protein
MRKVAGGGVSYFRRKTTRAKHTPPPSQQQQSQSVFLRKPPGRPQEVPSQTEGQSEDPEAGFSEIIAFHDDRKEQKELEISELESFINNQYKKNRESKEMQENYSSSDDDVVGGARASHTEISVGATGKKIKGRLPYITRRQEVKPHVVVKT